MRGQRRFNRLLEISFWLLALARSQGNALTATALKGWRVEITAAWRTLS